MEYIVELLRSRPEGVPQNQLVKHHDPQMVERLVDRMQGRGLIQVVFDRKAETGSGSRIIRLAHHLR